MADPVIRFVDVSVSYGGDAVLEKFSLDVRPGEFLTVVGNSGSGKTTALKLINGLLKAESGQVLVFGQDVGKLDRRGTIALRHRIGYVIQGVGLFPHMSVEKNITYVPDLQKKNHAESRKVAEDLIELVGLDEEMLKRHPNELSGGQRQRVGLARALAFEPEILLMDEPFGAVDEITKESLQSAILDIHKKLKKTIFFITHDINEALYLGDRVMVLKDGDVEQLDTPQKILENPSTEYVKKLISVRERFFE